MVSSMEKLAELQRQSNAWSGASDTALLQYLQAFSAQLSDRMTSCRLSLDELGQSATDLNTGVTCASTGMSLLSNACFLEKVTINPIPEVDLSMLRRGRRRPLCRCTACWVHVDFAVGDAV